ncbi:MAG: hypothetical protein EPO31_06300 [Gammaproteobacteria bacterium]|jgi:hypothetical protein|nr:MAG: hypothetical protein EPO31_06300 [Gammaproteobacteria bacterium]
MNNAFLQPIVIDYRLSRGVWIYLLLLHFFALLAVWYSHLHLAFSLPGSLVVLGSLAWRFRQWRDSAQYPPAQRFILDSENRWWLRKQEAGDRRLGLLPGSFVHPGMIILRFVDDTKARHTLILCRDNLDADALRRLRVRLRYPNNPPAEI